MSDLDIISDAVNELTRSRMHEEPYSARVGARWEPRKHTTDVASLLDQLTEALEPGGTADHGRAVPGSRPSARLEAIDVFMRIDQEAYLWCKTYCEQRRWDDTDSKLRALVGAATRMHPDERHDLARATRSWVTAARVTTGWDVPAKQLNSTCPLCGVRGSLRVRVGDGVTNASAHALCVNCHETWDDTNVGLLAEHIRAENGDESLYPPARDEREAS